LGLVDQLGPVIKPGAANSKLLFIFIRLLSMILKALMGPSDWPLIVFVPQCSNPYYQVSQG